VSRYAYVVLIGSRLRRNPICQVGLILFACAAADCRAQRLGEHRPLPQLNEEQCRAIRVAEAFVKANAYTNLALTPGTNVQREVSEENVPLEILLLMRRGTLRSGAVGLFPGRGAGGEGWTVLFEYAKDPVKPAEAGRPLARGYGRGVFVPPQGAGEPVMLLLDIPFGETTVPLGSPKACTAAPSSDQS
jgi:hypothetical protein